MPGLDVIQEAGRQLVICNACRYCEGYCPVFRAIETRRDFKQGDVFYLSNLCHDCRACYYACMYTPPHEFAINIPQILAEARMETYRRWSWPDFLGRAFKNRSVTVFLAAGMAALVAVLALLFIPSENLFAAHLGPGAFYEVVPYLAMVAGALILFFYGIAVWLRGGARFWSETSSALNERGRLENAGRGRGSGARFAIPEGRRTRMLLSGRAALFGSALLSLAHVLGFPERFCFHDAGIYLPGFSSHPSALLAHERTGDFWQRSAAWRSSSERAA